jgi:alkylated DNA repair dioxygenase AlkB
MIRLLTYKTCGAIYIPNFIDEETSNGAFNVITKSVEFEIKYMNVQGTLIGLPRSVAYFGDKPYIYSGITHNVKPFNPIVSAIKKLIIEEKSINTVVTQKSLEKLNTCLINVYQDETDSIAFHSDDEKELGPDNKNNILVASVSFGAERDFVIRTKTILQKQLGEENTDNFELKIGLKHGSLLIMYGDFQSRFEHSVPKAKCRKEARINLTYRVIE